ncbi:hypothetical protein XENOCAPTIV_002071 [Xenoophorus captivus]|uniref:Gelsolin-like domain-containing protein n=1 Tax=Xenoophorus captivus TaxID=1517983 RepID=A0ABV0RBK4_9TELE
MLSLTCLSLSTAAPDSVSHIDPAQEEAPVDSIKMSDECFGGSQLPHLCGGPTPCGGVAATEREQDLAILCQSSTPILSSAVAEHRRAVRPSRRTQGSRNPLRALAAREDIRQDYMGDRDNNAAEERGQAEKRAGAPEEDELFEQGVVESNCVYSLVENRLVPHELAWASIPSTSLLGSSEVLVFDFGSEVYMWHGRDVSLGRKNVALQLTHQVWVGEFDYSNCRVNPLDPTQCNLSVQPRGQGRPSWALLAVVSEDNETALFREKFLGPMCGSEDTVEVASERDEMQVNLMVQWFRATMQRTYSQCSLSLL